MDRNICIGLLAHVDAGKTTTSEALLYATGTIRKAGRVDRGDTFLDTHGLEKDRGITIFSKQAVFAIKDKKMTLVDTPGHTDFTAETERALSVLDYAVLVISAPEGVQAHTDTLWRMIRHYGVPCFIWVNKEDLSRRSRQDIIDELRAAFGDGVVDYSDGAERAAENTAMCSEDVLEKYLETGVVSDADTARLVSERRLFPCCFGSALKQEGMGRLIECLYRFTAEKEYPAEFGARVFKITRDGQGNRLTWAKITGGSLRVRDVIDEEKITQIRIYSGGKYETAEEVTAGDICCLCGLEKTYAGQGLGAEPSGRAPLTEAVFSYGVRLPEGTDPHTAYRKLLALADEDPALNMAWDSHTGEIRLMLLGRVQTEVLERIIYDRFGMDVELGAGKISYRETIAAPVLGAGHFEPLRHYAEVHLLMEPMPAGTGLVFESACPRDSLDINWQRLALTNLAEKEHIGVLTGAPVTDMKITLVSGRAHLKHTEGGDFRQACYRAVRQGLMKAENVLLEPYYDFTLEVPRENLGRAVSDVKAMHAAIDPPEGDGPEAAITGRAPVSEMQDYTETVLAYTKGRGRLSCRFGGYLPCHDTERVIREIGYDAERDTDNPADSVFCSHGAGVNVRWDTADRFMHVDSGVSLSPEGIDVRPPKVRSGSLDIDERELEQIMEREFGPIKRPKYREAEYNRPRTEKERPEKTAARCLLIDGYNVIFAWEDLSRLAAQDMPAARARLIDTLANYRGYTGCEIILVFDGHKYKGNQGAREEHEEINVVYTGENESADQYIERLAREIGKNYRVCAVSSDNMIQVAALRTGVTRMSSRELELETEKTREDIAGVIRAHRPKRVTIGDTGLL